MLVDNPRISEVSAPGKQGSLGLYVKGSGHVLECMGLSSMDVMVAVVWSCHACNSMAPHGITGLTCSKCTTGDSMERLHGSAGLTLANK